MAIVLPNTQVQEYTSLVNTIPSKQRPVISNGSLFAGYPVLMLARRGRNNSTISGSQQDYLVGKSGSPQKHVVVLWLRFKQNNKI